MASYSYNCPNCSGPLAYKPDLGKLKCDYCGSSFTLEEINEYIKNNPDKDIVIEEGDDKELKDDIQEQKEETSNTSDSLDHDDLENDQFKSYNCSNCGAEVVTTATTLTTFCYYCHSPVVLTDRTSGEFRPNKVIPFAIDKDRAEEILLDWVKKKKYVVRDFYSHTQLEKITGMYLPYWSIDTDFNIRIKGKGVKNKVYTRGDTQYTETSEYDISRNGNYEVNNISKLAYTKIDEGLINSITPYKFGEIKDFKNFYLNGFFSETYDKKFEDLQKTMDEEAKGHARNKVRSELYEYNSYHLEEEVYDRVAYEKNYLLLPAWILTYDYLGEKYVYAINGQTGKAYGKLPISNKLIVRDSIIVAIIFFVLFLLGGRFIW